ncbi:MAG: YlbF family regulator [Firmicutes bacterium]|nr:YlbF family regulator [Bacillota bacterium]
MGRSHKKLQNADIKTMDELVEMSGQIAKYASNNDVYNDFVKATDELKENEALWERVKSFLEADCEYRERYGRGEKNFDTQKALSQEYYKLMLDKKAAHFLESRQKLIEGMGKIYTAFFDTCCPDIML